MTVGADLDAGDATRRRLRQGSYIDVWAPDHPLSRRDGYVFEHRMMAYDAGLLKNPADQVHHRNHIRDDNRLDNFEVLDIASHARRHAENGVTNQYGTWGRRPAPPPRPGERLCKVCPTVIPDAARTDKVFCNANCRVRSCKAKKRSLTQPTNQKDAA